MPHVPFFFRPLHEVYQMFGEGERLAAQVQLYITILVSEPQSTRTATIACLRTLIVDLTQEIGAEGGGRR